MIILKILLLILALQNIKATEEHINAAVVHEKLENTEGKQNLLLTAKIYSTLFRERRVEQHAMIKKMLKSTYDKNYKLLKLAWPRILQVITQNNATITEAAYSSKQGLPQTNETLQFAVIHLLENCCLQAENFLHFPEISQRIFVKEKINNWRDIGNWCIGFVNDYPHIIDEPTVKLMDLLKQEINEELRDKDYFNPYYSKAKSEHPNGSKSKTKKKLKKGPSLAGQRNEL